MRNLKKFLALVLAMMMLFSLMVTVNTSTFTDDSDVTDKYAEAIDVMQTLKVLKGYADGNGGFALNPKGNVLRQEYAAILYRIHSGDVNDAKAASYAQYATFDDVDPSDWYAGYIGYCYQNELLKGTPSGNFYPTDEISGTAVIVGMLRALGYDRNNEFTGNSQWATNAQIQASRINLADVVGIPNLNGNATREQIAQLAYNTLLAEKVEWSDNLGGGYVGSTVTGSNNSGAQNPSVGGSSVKEKVTLGLTSFGLTVYNSTDHSTEMAKLNLPNDPFGRGAPTYAVVVKDEVIKVGYRTPAITFDTRMKEGEAEKALKALGITKIDTTDLKVNVNGLGDPTLEKFLKDADSNGGTNGGTISANFGPNLSASRNNKTVFSYLTSTNNSTVEVYVNNKSQIDLVVVITEFSHKLEKTDVTPAKGIKDAYITLDGVQYETDEFKVGDVVTYTRGSTDRTSVSAIEIVTVEPTTAIKGTLAKVDVNSSRDTIYTISGKNYVASDAAAGLSDSSLGETDYIYYLNSKGQIVYVDGVEEDTGFGTYAKVLSGEAKAPTWPAKGVTMQVQLLQSDGTVAVYPMATYTKAQIEALKKTGGAARYESSQTSSLDADEYYVIITGPKGDYSDDAFVMVSKNDGADAEKWIGDSSDGISNTSGSKLNTTDVYEYSVNASGYVTLSLVKALTTEPTTSAGNGGYYDTVKSGEAGIATNDTKAVITGENGPTAIINSDTVFILHNDKNNTADDNAYIGITGSANLGTYNNTKIDNSNATLIVEATVDASGNATYVVKYVFAVNVIYKEVSAVGEGTYYFIDPANYIGEVISDDETEYTYWATDNKGNEVKVTLEDKVPSAGVYQLSEDGTEVVAVTSGGSITVHTNKTVGTIAGNNYDLGGTPVFVNDPSIAVNVGDAKGGLQKGATVPLL